ncbi:MAG: nucleotidyltransferase family protein [Candidatus Omnitrophica bacterium]|nr:nucleotidyltransferase family protein [Candidatus Omnitrophota bacterium]
MSQMENVCIKEISSEAKLVLIIARWIVYNGELSGVKDLLIQECLEWKKFKEMLTYHELFSFVYPCLKKYLYFLPNEAGETLEKSYYYCVAHLSYLWEEFKHIVDAFEGRNIELVPIKGTAFLLDNIYADKSYLRPMCDIDLLIRKKSLPLVKETLKGLGYKKAFGGFKEAYWEDKNYHLSFTREKKKGLAYIVEAHWDLDYRRKRPILPDLWNRIRRTKVENREINLLSPEDTLFTIVLNQRHFGKMLCLKNACDVAMLLNKYNNELDWDYILKEAERGRMRTTLYFLLIQTKLLFNTQIPSHALSNLKIPQYKKYLIQKFITKNIFVSELNNRMKNLYLRSHFLMYDDFWEPVRYILNIPQEQFAKFYELEPYSKRTNLLYRIRCLYFIYRLF